MMFKACTRCNGDVFLEEYLAERDLLCLQCGRRTAVRVQRQPYADRRRIKPAR